MAGLVVEFSNQRGPARRLGPYDRLLFEGETLISVSGAVIAQHVNHAWQLSDGNIYTRLDCNMPVVVYLLSRKAARSERLGPFGDFSSVDGIAYVDRRVFAFADRGQGDWYLHDLGTHWKTMIVEPA